MREINFSAPTFNGIPQHEIQARRDWYNSLGNIARRVGSTVKDMADAYSTGVAARENEDWRRHQWENQLDQQEFNRRQVALQNRRYDDELRRKRAEEQADRDATEELRKDFLRQYGYGYNLDKYGLPGQFAMSRIRNARNWQDMVGAGQSLAQHIQMQDILEVQRGERAAREQEELDEQSGANLYGDIANRMSMSGINLANINELWRGTPTRDERQGRLDEMLGYRQQLLDFMSNPANARRVTPEMRRQLDDLNSAIFNWRTRMAPRQKVRF